jgi:hypothetical protein
MAEGGGGEEQAVRARSGARRGRTSDRPARGASGAQEGTAYNGHIARTCYHPLFVFNQDGDLERCALRAGSLALPGEVARWSLTSLWEKVVKIGAKVIAHGRYAIFQMAEVAVPRELFGRILDRIRRLRPPDPTPC